MRELLSNSEIRDWLQVHKKLKNKFGETSLLAKHVVKLQETRPAPTPGRRKREAALATDPSVGKESSCMDQSSRGTFLPARKSDRFIAPFSIPNLPAGQSPSLLGAIGRALGLQDEAPGRSRVLIACPIPGHRCCSPASAPTSSRPRGRAVAGTPSAGSGQKAQGQGPRRPGCAWRVGSCRRSGPAPLCSLSRGGGHGCRAAVAGPRPPRAARG